MPSQRIVCEAIATLPTDCKSTNILAKTRHGAMRFLQRKTRAEVCLCGGCFLTLQRMNTLYAHIIRMSRGKNQFFFALAALVLCLAAMPLAASGATVNGLPPDDEDMLVDTIIHESRKENTSLLRRKLLTPSAVAAKFSAGTVLGLDNYVKTWLKSHETYSLNLELQWDSRLKTFDCEDAHSTAELPGWLAAAADYNYPTFTFGLRYNFNHGTRMHRDAADWGEDMEVDYTTRLGDVVTLYGRFDRPLWRTRHATVGYYLGTGIGYALSHYDRSRHIDNELIGTSLNIYFTTGLYADFFIAQDVAIEAGIDFAHHSNGALYRPNKGANYLGPFVGLKYAPQPSTTISRRPKTFAGQDEAWRRHPLFVELSLGVGAKSLSEEWQNTQFNSQPSDPDYRKDKFSVYGAFSMQTDIMYRYARRWASGLGVDLFYGDYVSRVRYWESQKFAPKHISPWSVALALKHEAYYGRLSARVGIGYYLYRHMGTEAGQVEKPYYERVGLFYTFSKKTGLSAGFSINAHKTRADFTELQISYPFRL